MLNPGLRAPPVTGRGRLGAAPAARRRGRGETQSAPETGDVTTFVRAVGSPTSPVSSFAKSGFVPGTGVSATLPGRWQGAGHCSPSVISARPGGGGDPAARSSRRARQVAQAQRSGLSPGRGGGADPGPGEGPLRPHPRWVPAKTFPVRSSSFSPEGFASHRAGSEARGLAPRG